MSEPRGPRRYVMAADRELFGKARTVPWGTTTDNRAELSAAYRQHLVAVAVNQARRDNGWTIEQLAEHVGMGAETLRRKLRGESWISWIDASALVLTLSIALPSANDLTPS